MMDELCMACSYGWRVVICGECNAQVGLASTVVWDGLCHTCQQARRMREMPESVWVTVDPMILNREIIGGMKELRARGGISLREAPNRSDSRLVPVGRQ